MGSGRCSFGSSFTLTGQRAGSFGFRCSSFSSFVGFQVVGLFFSFVGFFVNVFCFSGFAGSRLGHSHRSSDQTGRNKNERGQFRQCFHV